MRWNLSLLSLFVLMGCDGGGAKERLVAAPSLSNGRIEVMTALPSTVDPCLGQSVKDLGVGAKLQPDGRRWRMGPEKIHAALVGKGEVSITAESKGQTTEVRVVAGWKDALDGASRSELERRLTDLTARIGFFCDQRQASVQCRSGVEGSLTACGGP